MWKQLFDLVAEMVNEQNKKSSAVNDKIVELVEELEKLEIKYVDALADAERWGDLEDSSHWRTVEVTKLKRLMESKQRMIDTLQNK